MQNEHVDLPQGIHINTPHIPQVKHLIQNLGPIWKAICCGDMGVEMPASAVEKILHEQHQWVKERKERTGKDFFHKR